MRAKLVVRRRLPTCAVSINTRFICVRSIAHQTKLSSTQSRPSLPFLLVPKASPSIARSFTSDRRRWLRHEAKLVARYTITLWGLAACAIVIFFIIGEETSERVYPTPHDWHYLTRKFLRDAHDFKNPKSGEVNWARCLELARSVVIRLEDPKLDGLSVSKLSGSSDPSLEIPTEFISVDMSSMPEDWRRGYFQAIMLAAEAAEHVDGWVRDRTRNIVSAPEFVIGPSNPRPKPIPTGRPHAPREEDCEPAYPSPERFYLKILTTVGITPRHKMEAALQYASFLEFKSDPASAEALYGTALAQATVDLDKDKLPYNPKTFVLRAGGPSPSMNVLDCITAIANHKARNGDVSSSLPIYVSLLKARRSLSDTPPPQDKSRPKRLSAYEKLVEMVSQPEYPPAPPDGTAPPWRNAYERCQEASLNLYIGEILYATSSYDEGLAWTRDGVDLAEEQLRALGPANKDESTKQTCRECLSTGLENWSTMVSRLATAEEAKKDSSSSTSSMFSFWGGSQDVEGRWAAEEAVVQERTRRTKEIMEDVAPPASGLMSIFKA